MWFWRRMEKISWTYHVRNEGASHRAKEERNILRTVELRKRNWTSHILRWKCVLKYVVERKVEVKRRGTGRQ
jgi:hypothetical protein